MKKIPFFAWPVIILLAWSLIQALVSFYPTYLWFDNLGFTSVLWTNIFAKVFAAVVFGLLFFAIAAVNIFIAKKLTSGIRQPERGVGFDAQGFIKQLFGEEAGDIGKYINVTPKPGFEKKAGFFWFIGIFIVSFFMGLSAISQWEVLLKALNVSSFGITDPIFNQDMGFYIFTFPLYKFLQGFVFSALIMSLFASIWIYLTSGGISFAALKLDFAKGVKAHLAGFLAILALVFAWGLWLGELEILYSARGVVFGAGYTDVNAQLLGYNVQIMALFILVGLFLINIFQKDYRWPLAGLGAYFAVAVVMGGLYPAIVQNLQVKPNEISMEAPYIRHAIEYTRKAYGLDKIEEREFAAAQNLSLSDIRQNSRTISNIRLWDPRPLIKTYRQLQGIRLYYDFSDVDVDRYNIDGRYQQVMLSPREMRVEKITDKAQTWINQHLKFTHGYGLCMSPVNEQTPEGLPNLIVKDIPPTTKTDLVIKRPEIYYGEETSQYVIVNTDEEEFDYPKGDNNVYAKYQGKGGVQLSSMLRRVAFAIKYSDLKIVLTDYIKADSRIMFDRNIRGRVAKIAPFLSYDSDPY
ncbi:MAG: UPF0182 family protein, partial [bacterium]